MKRRIRSLLLLLVIAGALTLPAAAKGPYPDVPEDHWAAGDIARATELGIFKGSSDGDFGLGRPITRAEFVTALVRFFGWTKVQPAQPSFSDVPAGSWFYSAVETALAGGAIAPSGTAFRPEDPVTRSEMVELLLRGMGYASLAGRAGSFDCRFSDVSAKKGFITLAYDLGLISGVGKGRFDPDGPAAREQAAAVLVRAYDRLYAASTESPASDGGTALAVDTPAAQDADMPITPLEPILALYDALRTLRGEGQDMSQVVLCLTGGGVRTIVSGGKIISTSSLSSAEVEALLASGSVSTHYSHQYESAYLIYQPNGYQTVTVWYQSQESLAAKLQLARLFGVTKYRLLP